MKSYLFVFSVILLFVNGIYSQTENNDGKLALITKDVSSNTYTFTHEVKYFEAFENRLIFELNKDEEVIKSLSIDDYTCKVIFKEELSVEDCKEHLSILVRKLNFSGFEIK